MSKFSARTKRRQSFHLPKMPKWKGTHQSSVALKNGFIFLILLIALFVVKEIWISIRASQWDGKNQLTIVYEQGNAIGLIKVDPTLEQVTTFPIPPDAMIPLAMGFEDYRADKVMQLARQEKIEAGLLLSRSTTRFLGIVTSSYVTGWKGQSVSLNSLAVQSLLKRTHTNLSSWDLIRLLLFSSRLSAGQIRILDPVSEGLTQAQTLPDGSSVLVFEEDSLDKIVLRDLADPRLLREKVTWEVFNATYHDGLAQAMKRILANSGFDVSGIRQAQHNEEKTAIFIRHELKDNETIQQFAAHFGFPVVVNSNKVDRSDIAIYLGEDFWESYFTVNTPSDF